MDPSRHARIKDIFLAVVALPAAGRAAELARLCTGDEALRREVEALLAHHREGTLLGAPPAGRHGARITFDQGSIRWQEEQQRLLRQRVRLWALILHAIVALGILRTMWFFDGWSRTQRGVLLGVGIGLLGLFAASAWVTLAPAPSTRALRRCEIALTASVGTAIFCWGFGWLTRGQTLAAPPSPLLHALLRDGFWVVSPDGTTHFRVGTWLLGFPVSNYWSLLAGFYGFLVPASARRSAAVMGALGLGAAACLIAAAVVNPGLRPHLATNLVSSLSLVAIFAAISSYVGSQFRMLRRAVFDARQVGQYRLERLLGKGAMGEVYLGQHQLLRRPCAVKLIRPERAGSEEWLARFEREVQAMAQLTHPNTVEVYDFGRTEDDSFFCAMEYVPGTTLEALVRAHGPLPAGRAIHLLAQVCGALTEAHGKGLVHRDVKPGNILICERGGVHDFVKLLDFGLVHVQAAPGRGVAPSRPALWSSPGLISAERPGLTMAGQLLGTPTYMTPEQIRGEQPDARGDIYSLGAVACFLLTGKPPYERGTLDELLVAHLSAPLPSLQARVPGVPAQVEAIVQRCLAKGRQDRPQSIEAVRAALCATAAAGTWDAAQARSWWQVHGQGMRSAPMVDALANTEMPR